MQHRIFIAINFPENIQKELFDYQLKWPELPVKWVKSRNLHITLEFLGSLSGEELLEICQITKEVASRQEPFNINLTKICYGPPKKPPRMIWAEGNKSKELSLLKDDLTKALMGSQLNFSSESRAFSPHVTLGRIKVWQWRAIDPEDRLEVNEDVSLGFKVNSIEVMESVLKRGGAEYMVLESCQFAS